MMRRLRWRLGWVATNQENTSMHSLLRSAAAAVIVLGLTAGAAPEARADVAYDSFGKWFDAIVSGDHNGQRSHSVDRCAGSYSGCSGNAPAAFNRNGHADGPVANRPGDRDEATDRGGPAQDGGGNSNSGGDGGNTGGDGGNTGGDGGDTGGDGGDGDAGYGDGGGGYGDGDRHRNQRGKGHSKRHGKGHSKDHGKDGDRGQNGNGQGQNGNGQGPKG